MKKLFIFLVLGTLISYGLWFVAPFFWENFYDTEILDLLSWNGYGSVININGLSPYIIALAYIIVSIGLVYFKKWARTAFLLLACFNVVSAPFWGMSIQTGYEMIFSYLTNLGDGAILVMAYFTSISNEFN